MLELDRDCCVECRHAKRLETSMRDIPPSPQQAGKPNPVKSSIMLGVDTASPCLLPSLSGRWHTAQFTACYVELAVWSRCVLCADAQHPRIVELVFH